MDVQSLGKHRVTLFTIECLGGATINLWFCRADTREAIIDGQIVIYFAAYRVVKSIGSSDVLMKPHRDHVASV